MLSRLHYSNQILGISRPLVVLVLFMGLLFMSGHATSALAQANSDASASSTQDNRLDAPRLTATKDAKAPQKVNTKSAWKDLSASQQQALKPLAGHWSGLSDERRRKWLVISRNYPALPAAEQAKMHSRMTDWVSLSQQQRNQARLNYAETKKLSAEEKTKQWEAYQALSQEEKRKLAAQGSPKPFGASVTRSVTHQKLAHVPVTKLAPVPGSRLAAAKQPFQENTLLPQFDAMPAEAAPVEQTPSQSN